ncbi:MAG: metal-binding protein [Nostoc sp. NMS2]|uniref:metal-binding protein n=1 Tax=Nostoc sp. NMS2 TaxID=2815389 RepID=UPI0025EE48FA|nr:metal-binding protein [Nostoc sp. NMS2]MBN3993841.1 metal-binding protein [Nostoc sp. NMS2]
MASGKWHDRSILISSPLAGGLTYYTTTNWVVTGILTISYLLGGMYLSPDLDLKSKPFYRWGFLRWIWKPYQKLIPHRGRFFNRNPLSHAPIIGTILRVGYLFLLCFIPVVLSGVHASLLHWIAKNYSSIFLALIGIELSGLTHLLMDITSTNFKK